MDFDVNNLEESDNDNRNEAADVLTALLLLL